MLILNVFQDRVNPVETYTTRSMRMTSSAYGAACPIRTVADRTATALPGQARYRASPGSHAPI